MIIPAGPESGRRGDAPTRSLRLVTVVIPCYNAADTIGSQLDALVAQTYRDRWEVVVSDNGSTDSTRAVVARWRDRLPGLRMVDSSDRRGPAHARNVGAEASSGELIAFCDADDVADAAWLTELVSAAGHADVVGGALENSLLNDPQVRDWRRDLGTTALERPLGFLPFVPSGNCAVWRDVLRTLGGWRDDYAYGEDVEFSWRAQLKGYRVDFVPGAIMHYRHRNSLRTMTRQVFNFGEINCRLYRDYRSQGARPRPARQVATSYLYTLTRLPYLAMSRRRRGFWLIVTAANWGHIVGSVRFRVWCL